jgi:SHS family lactate transporter-like MFS transporter
LKIPICEPIALRDADDDAPTPGWPYAVGASILGWILDAFDFFVVIFLVDTLAANFEVHKQAIVWTISVSLAMRPVGALLFGAMADRFGRRRPLMLCVLYFSSVTLLSAFAPNYAVFVALRGLYGIGMGGFWGVGASLAMESAPRRHRGLLSGLMQAGYPLGYLLAAVGVELLLPHWSWRAMFGVGVPVAFLTVGLAARAPESAAWQQHSQTSVAGMFPILWEHRKGFLYLLLVMVGMTSLSHGTQDLYPDFLKTVRGLARPEISQIAILYNICAILGALLFGRFSEFVGRRRSIILALCLCLAALYPWAFVAAPLPLIAGACLMQSGVQGAFGIIPAHLNELAPDAIRSLFPGFVYQLGVLIASPAVSIQYALRNRLGYSWALALFESVVICSLVIIFACGPERKGRNFRA